MPNNIDDSFTKPGEVPFKWEIRPGVPKLHSHHQPPSNHRSSSLKPPPSSSSISASPLSQSSRFHSDKPMIGRRQPEVVSLGCFQTRTKGSQKKMITNKLHADTVYKSDIEALSRWSVSTQNSRSPFYDSPPLSSSSFSSYRSSPLMASDVEWAGYGLF